MELWGTMLVGALSSYPCLLLCKNSTPLQQRIPLKKKKIIGGKPVSHQIPIVKDLFEKELLKSQVRSSRTKNRMEQLSHHGWKKHKKSMLRSCSKIHHKITRGRNLLILIHKTLMPNSSSWDCPSPCLCCSQWHILLPRVVSMPPYRAVGNSTTLCYFSRAT